MRGIAAFASGTSKRPLPPAGTPRSNGVPVANDIATPETTSSWYSVSGTLGLKVPSVAVTSRVGLLADGTYMTHSKVTGVVGNATLEMICFNVAGVVDRSTTATPDSSACVTDPNDPPHATSTDFVAAR